MHFVLLDLCPPGSFNPVQITLPPPPEQKLDLEGGDADSNQAFLENLMWPYSSTSGFTCKPCPACSFTETAGRPTCLPCPAWHSTPIFGSIPGEGGEWIETVCPRRGRHHVLLGDFVDEAFGRVPVGVWFESLSELTRISIFVFVALGSLLTCLTAVVIIYWCVDVQEMLTQSSNELRPLYLEAAFVAKTVQRTEHERTARVSKLMKEVLNKEKYREENVDLNN